MKEPKWSLFWAVSVSAIIAYYREQNERTTSHEQQNRSPLAARQHPTTTTNCTYNLATQTRVFRAYSVFVAPSLYTRCTKKRKSVFCSCRELRPRPAHQNLLPSPAVMKVDDIVPPLPSGHGGWGTIPPPPQQLLLVTASSPFGRLINAGSGGSASSSLN